MGRPGFSTTIQKDLQVQPGEARCHCVSYKIIEEIITKRKEENCEVSFKEALKDLYNALNPQCRKNTYSELPCEIKENSLDIEKLISIYNNTRANLRVGDASTNSSIGNALDFPANSFKKINIKVDGQYDWKYYFDPTKPINGDVLIANNETNTIILDLLDAMANGQEFHIYTYDDSLVQSSDNKRVLNGNVTECTTPIAIELEEGFLLLMQNKKNKPT